jgi:hypothetical protein
MQFLADFVWIRIRTHNTGNAIPTLIISEGLKVLLFIVSSVLIKVINPAGVLLKYEIRRAGEASRSRNNYEIL